MLLLILAFTAWLLVVGLALAMGFLLFGALRSLAVASWRLEHLEVVFARRQGLSPGTRAPAFSLPSMAGPRVSLKGLAGRRVLLVFTQSCEHPWKPLVAELDRLGQQGQLQVLLVEAGGPEAARTVADAAAPSVPVLWQEQRNLARRYRVFAMPFAFLIDERGIIRARGIAANRQHLDFLLAAAGAEAVARAAPVRSLLETFVPRSDDIFVVTYPRSGTTWMQMILYQLTTDGEMNFGHITQVCPWLERALSRGTDVDALPSPRVFKSHLPYGRIPKGPCKYIYVVRDGKDVAVSYYHFQKTHMGFQGTFEEFFEQFLAGEVHYGSWYRHVRGWWRHRADANVLLLHYEDLVADLEGCLRRMAVFIGREIAPERFPGILERCSFAFMKEHEDLFDPLTAMLYEHRLERNSHLRQGRAGGWEAELSPAQAAHFDEVFGPRLRRLGLDLGAVMASADNRLGRGPTERRVISGSSFFAARSELARRPAGIELSRTGSGETPADRTGGQDRTW